MIFYLSIFILITHLIGRFLFVKKIWFAPPFAAAQESVWIVLWLLQSGTWPLIVLSLADAAIYIYAIPKWYRERR